MFCNKVHCVVYRCRVCLVSKCFRLEKKHTVRLTGTLVGNDELTVAADVAIQRPLIPTHCRLVSLSLSCCKLVDNDVVALVDAIVANKHSTALSLRSLDLSENPFGDRGAEALASFVAEAGWFVLLLFQVCCTSCLKRARSSQAHDTTELVRPLCRATRRAGARQCAARIVVDQDALGRNGRRCVSLFVC